MLKSTHVILVDDAAIERAAAILREGGLVAFPTETVYGLGAIATSDDAVEGIFRAKGRPAFNPLIVHVADLAMARRCVAEWPERAQTLAERFWPGPLTLVLPKSDAISKLATAKAPTVAVRMPASSVALKLIETTGLPIAAPSANRSNHVSPTVAKHVLDDLNGRIDLILDAGPTAIGLESTVLDLTQPAPIVLRPGSITLEEISQALGIAIATQSKSKADAIAGPGMSPVHYAPDIPAVRVESVDELIKIKSLENASVFLFDSTPVDFPEGVRVVRFESAEEAARLLYRRLRACETDGTERIVVVLPKGDSPPWRALRDRLIKATKAYV